MVSASVFLCVERGSGPLLARANGGIKIPLRASYGFDANSEIVADENQIGFKNIVIALTGSQSKTQTWTNRDGELEYQESPSVSDDRRISMAESRFGRLLSPLAVIPAFAHSWQGTDCEYRTLTLAGKKPTALRFQPQPADPAGRARIVIQAVSVSNLTDQFDEDSWLNLPWEKALTLEAEYDASVASMISIGAKVPIIGSCQLELARHERR